MDDASTVRRLLNAEGAAVFVVALAGYVSLGGPWWLLVVLALAPDLSMVGYLVDERVGAAAYDAVHTYVTPLALAAVGVWTASRLALLVALVWAGHIGADRALGYGLKYASGFGDTHLDRV